MWVQVPCLRRVARLAARLPWRAPWTWACVLSPCRVHVWAWPVRRAGGFDVRREHPGVLVCAGIDHRRARSPTRAKHVSGKSQAGTGATRASSVLRWSSRRGACNNTDAYRMSNIGYHPVVCQLCFCYPRRRAPGPRGLRSAPRQRSVTGEIEFRDNLNITDVSPHCTRGTVEGAAACARLCAHDTQ